MNLFKSTPYKILLFLLFANTLPLIAARPSAFNSDLPILYRVVAGLLFLIVEFKKAFKIFKSLSLRIINFFR
ncbi:MAG: hypothetical protein ACOVSR_00680 [Bacteroidia bacterium]